MPPSPIEVFILKSFNWNEWTRYRSWSLLNFIKTLLNLTKIAKIVHWWIKKKILIIFVFCMKKISLPERPIICLFHCMFWLRVEFCATLCLPRIVIHTEKSFFSQQQWPIVWWPIVWWAIVEWAIVEWAIVWWATVEWAIVQCPIIEWAIVQWAIVDFLVADCLVC